MRFLPLVLAFFFVVGTQEVSRAHAQVSDVWVDPVLGNDSNSGTELEPLRTITAAVALPDAMVRLRPGLYSSATGEVFPIRMEGLDSIVSLGNASNTRILLPDGPLTSGSSSIRITGESSIAGVTIEQPGTTLTALDSRDAPFPINGSLRLTDSRVLGGSIGVSGFRVGLIIERCEFVGQYHVAVFLSVAATRLEDVTIRNAGKGVYADGFGSPLTLERVSILNVQDTAIDLYNSNYAVPFRVAINDCLLAGHEFGLVSDAHPLFNEVSVRGSTIVSDRGRGVHLPMPSSGGFFSVIDSIVAGHPLGDVPGVSWVGHSLIEDGAFPIHHVGSLSGDPMFIDPANGDFRLGWGSPCIDAASPGFSRDLNHHPRVVDGDLDLSPAPDMGALEHRTLAGPASIRLGQSVPLEVTGPVGGFSTVVISPAGYAASGATTQYGRFFLDPSNNFRLAPVPTFGLAPTPVVTPNFTDPALVGSRIGIQALTRSFAAPAGGAFSEPILVRIDP